MLCETGSVGQAAWQRADNQDFAALTTARRDTADVESVSDPRLHAVRRLMDGSGPDVVVDTVGSIDEGAQRILSIEGTDCLHLGAEERREMSITM